MDGPKETTFVRPSFDPHGYEPIEIDEACLSDVERHEEMMEFLHSIGDRSHNISRNWKLFLTPDELQTLRELERAPPRSSPFFVGGFATADMEEQYELVRRARLRAYARDKYANSQRIFYGDGVPWRQAGGCVVG